MRGRFVQARSILDEAMEVARQLGLITDLGAGFQRSAGYIDSMAGDLRSAETALREGLETLERIGDVGHGVSVAADLGLVLLEMDGHEQEVLALADETAPLIIEDDVDAVARWDAARARAVARIGDLAEAERLARRSVQRAWATDYVELRGISKVALAEVLQRASRMAEAADALREALSVYEAKGDVVSVAATRRKIEGIEARNQLSDEEAERLAVEAQHAMRRRRR
jgi:tetratricopeptide (TPR) repeat protein